MIPTCVRTWPECRSDRPGREWTFHWLEGHPGAVTAPKSLVARVFTLLGAFTSERPSANLSELSRATGLALSTTHRLVSELVAWRALVRDEHGRYRIGVRLWELGALSPSTLDLRERAMPFLEDLYEVTHQNVQLAVRDGMEALYVERISAHDAVSIVTRMGSRLPLHATGVGLVMLAHAAPEVQEQALAGPLKQFTAKTIATPSRLREALAMARRDGFVISDAQIELITLSVAAPIRGADDSVVAAVSIVVPKAGVEPSSLVPVVRTAARGISRALGAPSAQRSPTRHH